MATQLHSGQGVTARSLARRRVFLRRQDFVAGQVHLSVSLSVLSSALSRDFNEAQW